MRQQGMTPPDDAAPPEEVSGMGEHERRQAEAALRRSEAVLAQAGQMAHLGAWELNLATTEGAEIAGATLHWSDEVYRIFGYAPGGVAVTNELFFAHVPENEHARIGAAVGRALTDKHPYSIEHRIIRRDGVERTVLEYAEAVLDDGGRPIRLIGAVQDITERKQAEAALRESEERLRVLANNLPHVMIYQVVDEPDGRRRFSIVSASVMALHEITPEAAMADPSLLYNQVDSEYVPSLLAAEVDSERTMGVMRMEVRFRLPSGRARWSELTSTPRRLADGRMLWDGVEVDITARKKAEMERLEIERKMLHAQKLESLGVMAGGIAHDFNNLLMGVMGNLELAAMQLPESSPVQGFLEQSMRAANRAADLTRQILAYTGRGKFVVRELNLSDLVLENIHMLKTVIAKNVTLDVRTEPGLPAIVADAGQIQQVVMNLITNAAEAVGTQDGNVCLTTGARYYEEPELRQSRLEEKPLPGRFVWLDVADNGCGMDQATQERLFDPFFTTKFTGRGLGMSALLGIVRGHQGAILIDSAPGRGSVFRVLFPAAREGGRGNLPG